MTKHHLQSQIKSTSTAYILFFFLFGTHYAYLGKWGLQFLFWFTLGGLGVWGLIDLFTMSSKVEAHNANIYRQIDEIDKRERNDDQARQMAMIAAARGNS
ncbi:TM2 domain-containing protein [Aequorivita viscosa]|uniref:TM2 domain-containing protein n=1 Tax=Aequorivita viscosa TaxID=797419 RepID=A0A1M6MUN2_9FLAO|nr:TM2 domain-containing protein [Aequorivita viscosa]SHJ87132.1 TM2 domain-containing protein [Aequorivita viscosa]